MMPSDTLINLKLKSFARFDDAMAMSDLLNSETGADYSIMSDNHLGFTVKRNQENTVNEEPKPVVSNNGDRHEKKTYRQSFRGFLEHFSELILGIFLAVSPYTGLGWIFSLFNIQVIPEWFNLSESGKVVSIGGYVLILYGLRFIYSYYARKLFIEDEFVLSKERHYCSRSYSNSLRRHQNCRYSSNHYRKTARHWHPSSCFGRNQWGSGHYI